MTHKSGTKISPLPALLTSLSLLFQPALAGLSEASAQESVSYRGPKCSLVGEVYLSGETPEEKSAPGSGTTVIVVSYLDDGADTSYTTVGNDGKFVMKGLPAVSSHVSFSMMGYQEQADFINLKAGENKVIVFLKPESTELDAAIVKETVPPLSVVGDTVVFHASAVKTEKGENAIDILEQMPGVEVEEGGVKVLNEEVATVYVDGAMLFGDTPMDALNNLSAGEVVNIKSYQEYANKDPNHKISKTENKRRVLDIQTRSKPKMVYISDFIGGGGFDTDDTYRKFRYTLGNLSHVFSESLHCFYNFNINNINNSNNRRRGNSFRVAGGGGAADLRSIDGGFLVNRQWMSPVARNFVLGNVGGGYSYSNKLTVNESVSEQIYFPCDDYESRRIDKSSWSNSMSGVHTALIFAGKALKDGNVGFNAVYSRTHSMNEGRSSNYNSQDELPRQGSSSSNRSDRDNGSFTSSVSFDKGFIHKFRVGLNGSFELSGHDGTSMKVDTTTSTITYKTLDINSRSTSRSGNAGGYFRYEISERQAVSISYGYSRGYSHSEQYAFDIARENSPLDTVNTYSYTHDNNTHSSSLSYQNYFESIKANLKLSLNFESTGFNRSEFFPDDFDYDRRFNTLSPHLNFGTESMLNRWNLSVSTGGRNPSVEQIRPRLENSNLYNVTVGNPDIRQSHFQSFRMSYSTCLGKELRRAVRANESGETTETVSNINTLSFSAGFNRNSDVIVNRRTYYSRETFLEEYNYTMPAQSTLTTYENVDDSYSANAAVNFDTPLQFIMCNLSSALSMNWDQSPSYINDVLTVTENFSPNIRLRLRSNFSRNFRFNINASCNYVYSSNTMDDTRSYFTERLRAGFEINNIFKHLYLGGNYLKTFTQGIEVNNINDNILDLAAGLKMGANNQYDFSINAHDLFNRESGFSTSTNADFISNSWNHNFGRYVMFVFTYHFDSLKSRMGKKESN